MTCGHREFVMHLHCANCQRPSTQQVAVPIGEGMPSDVDEFLEGIENQPPRFYCPHCESLIGTLVGVTLGRGADGEQMALAG